MCGIAGGFWREPQGQDPASLVSSALDQLKRRGPNDRGLESVSCFGGQLSLGHTRLSIIDLSDGGHQPKFSTDGMYAISFNGEIYNYRELRTELARAGYQFETDSDTEVLLAAWQHWGKECLKRLVGMFAFVVFDRQSAKLTAVRDAFGIKPFFYSCDEQRYLFASEHAALHQLTNEPPKLNHQRAYDYLVHGDYDGAEETMFQDVLHLRPGHLIELELNRSLMAKPECWWAPTVNNVAQISFEDAADEFRQRFLDSVRLHLRSDVAIGAALSGGLDSSALVCAMRHLEPDLPLKTFSYIAKGSSVSEEPWVDRINEFVKADAYKVHANPEELLDDLDDLIRVQGEPFSGSTVYAQYRVFKLAREHGVTVTLDGQGADELLAGYFGFPGQRIQSLIDTGRPVEALRFLIRWSRWPGRSLVRGLKFWAGEITSGTLYKVLRRIHGRPTVPRWLDPHTVSDQALELRQPRYQEPVSNRRGRRVVSTMASILVKRGLSHLLRHGDRNSMRFSVESRVPFLTVELADFLLSLPEEYLISPQGETKRVMRAGMRGIVPDEVLDRRDKIGFATPEKSWLPKLISPQWTQEVDRVPLLNASVFEAELAAIQKGQKPFTSQVWRWLNFLRWHKLNFTTVASKKKALAA